MAPRTHHELREAFLNYFEDADHQRVGSSSLVPQNDPTLLFANAGMNQFKPYFLGEETPDVPRATTSQKCVRAGGKHNDLENVGYTARHHTFFEMLGNFSFGDYFKSEAIRYGWDFLTNVAGLDPAKLWITVFHEDEEARAIWADEIGVPADRILGGDEKDNYWSMGDTGPCGPCSEIHFDQGPSNQWNCDDPDNCGVFCECDRYLEVWNLVFMQFDQSADGTKTPLPSPSIDTGMGLERLAAVVQGVTSNYDTDLFAGILARIGEVLDTTYGDDDQVDTAMRVIADHARAATFLIADGVLPDNEGRGYVLRRIMRRAIRYGRRSGRKTPFLADVCDAVVAEMRGPYPELDEYTETVRKIVTLEEERFGETLDRGLTLFDNALATAREQDRSEIPGEVVFRLYDTYGFPVDLTALLAREAGIGLDMAGYEAAMAEQREQSRAGGGAAAAATTGPWSADADAVGATAFVGYRQLAADGTVVRMRQPDGEQAAIAQAAAGETVQLALNTTPFYATSGGQIHDVGEVRGPDGYGRVTDVRKTADGLFIHTVEIREGSLAVDQPVTSAVDASWRAGSAAHHTSTHLLQAALRKHLGKHVRQAGSLVEPERLRFDFSHFAQLAADEKRMIEDEVNAKIRDDIAVTTDETDFDTAIARGALAFFGEKYGREVRMVSIGDYSIELCGGTHVERTGNIGVWMFDSEGSVSAGVRRVEAVTGPAAVRRVRQLEDNLDQVAARLNVPRASIIQKLDGLLETMDARDRELQQLRSQVAGDAAADLQDQIEEIGPWPVLAAGVSAADGKALREMADRFREQYPDVVLFLASGEGDRPSLFVSVPDAITGDLHAGNLLKEAAAAMAGRGGGKANSAQGGGGDPAKIPAALSAFREAVNAASS